MGVDAFLLGTSVVLSYLLRFDFSVPSQFRMFLLQVIVLFIVCHFVFLFFFKLYQRSWRHASVLELQHIVESLFFGSISFFLINSFVFHFPVPRSVYLISWVVSVCFIGLSRFLQRFIYEKERFIECSVKKKTQLQRTLIIGAGEAGKIVIRELKCGKDSPYIPIAVVDDDPRKHGLVIHGIKVVGDRHDIPFLVENLNIQAIIIAIPSAKGKNIREIVDICKKTKCTVKILPCIRDWINGKVHFDVLRDVQIEDLLKRDPVQLDFSDLSSYIEGKCVLVTGAGGSIGSELCRQLIAFKPNKLILLGRGENSIYEIEQQLKSICPHLHVLPVIADVRDLKRMEHIFRTFRPHVVFHAAAHKHVPLMERYPSEAVINNVFGTKNVAELSDAYGAEKFVMISTDKAVNPTSVMGATKKIAEMIVQLLNEKSETSFCSVRFGNVLGSRGSVVPTFKRQIAQGGPVTVTHPEMIRYFMTIPEAVQLVLQAAALCRGGEIFLLDMGEPVKIVDLAKDLIQLSGFEPDVDIPIIYTGVREGEKLYEELLTAQEEVFATKNNRIFISKAEHVEEESFMFLLHRLEHAAKNDEESIIDVLMEIIPTYKPSRKGKETVSIK